MSPRRESEAPLDKGMLIRKARCQVAADAVANIIADE